MSFGSLSSMQMASNTKPMSVPGAQALDKSGNQYRSAGGQFGGSGMGTSAAGGGGGFSAGGMMSMFRVK